MGEIADYLVERMLDDHFYFTQPRAQYQPRPRLVVTADDFEVLPDEDGDHADDVTDLL